jgi:hypothetical protein
VGHVFSGDVPIIGVPRLLDGEIPASRVGDGLEGSSEEEGT